MPDPAAVASGRAAGNFCVTAVRCVTQPQTGSFLSPADAAAWNTAAGPCRHIGPLLPDGPCAANSRLQFCFGLIDLTSRLGRAWRSVWGRAAAQIKLLAGGKNSTVLFLLTSVEVEQCRGGRVGPNVANFTATSTSVCG